MQLPAWLFGRLDPVEVERIRNNYRRLCTSRLRWIDTIVKRLDQTQQLLPSPAQEMLYDEALDHVVRVLSCKRFESHKHGDIFGSRKLLLREILNLLHYLERKRLYNPPADNEIGYYLLMKKHLRSITTFFDAINPDVSPICDKYGCYTPFWLWHNVMELAELNMSFSDLALYVSEMDTTNGSALKPSMGTKDGCYGAPVMSTAGSRKERTNKFYRHKFMLALLDLRSAVHLARSPPSVQEKNCYEGVLDHIVLPLHPAPLEAAEVSVSVYNSDRAFYLSIEKMLGEICDMEGHFTRITSGILEKLSISQSWENLLKSYRDEIDHHHDKNDVLNLVRRNMVGSCMVSVEDLPAYVADVGRCVQIATHASLLVMGCLSGVSEVSDMMNTREENKENMERIGWQAFHALTLLRRHSCSTFGITKSERDSEEGGIENIKILKDVLGFIRQIGDCGGGTDGGVRLLDREETCLMNNIFQSVASSAQLFMSAVAYDQRRDVIQRGGISPDEALGVRAAEKRKEYDHHVNPDEIMNKFDDLLEKWNIFTKMLGAYRTALLKKLQEYQRNPLGFNLNVKWGQKRFLHSMPHPQVKVKQELCSRIATDNSSNPSDGEMISPLGLDFSWGRKRLMHSIAEGSPHPQSKRVKKEAPMKLPRPVEILMELPEIALNIVSFLEARDVSSLASCSKFWRDICDSDCVWMELYRRRWPHQLSDFNRKSISLSAKEREWKSLYMKRHGKMGSTISSMVSLVRPYIQSEGLKVEDYMGAVNLLCDSKEIGFGDVCFFLFRSTNHVLLNLIGLHYSIYGLHIPAEDVVDALASCQVAERRVRVSWCLPGNAQFGFYIARDDYSFTASLSELAVGKEELLYMLELGEVGAGEIGELENLQVSSRIPPISSDSQS